MIEVQNTLVHEDVVNENFVCNLNKCKGICCIEGDSGAPLERDELAVLDEIYPLVKPYMTEKGIAVIEEFGTYVKDFEGDYTTPCVDTNKECAYVIMENGISKCAIENGFYPRYNYVYVFKNYLISLIPTRLKFFIKRFI